MSLTFNNSKDVIAITISLLILCNLYGQKNELENNTGNIAEGGLVAYDDGRMFFTNLDSTVKGLYSVKLDGTDLKKISDHQPNFMNISNGWLYFDDRTSDLRGIYKMKIDGTGEEFLSKNSGHYINVIGDWIYYINWDKLTSVCKMKKDGSSQQTIFEGHYQCLSTDGHFLYFSPIGGEGIFKGSFDGRKLEKLTTDKVWNPLASGGYVYFRDDDRDYNIYRIDNNGKGKLLVSKDHNAYDRFILFKGWIYLNNGQMIKRMNLNSPETEIIFEGRVMEMGVAPNLIFFRSVKTNMDGDLYDQTVIQKVSN